MAINNENQIIFHEPDDDGGSRLRFGGPAGIVSTHKVSEVQAKLEQVDRAAASGLYGAGFVTYEAAAGLDSAFCTHKPTKLPLVWFGLFKSMERLKTLEASRERAYFIGAWTPSISRQTYIEAIGKVKDYIAAGDTYQVNYTQRLKARFAGDALSFFQKLIHSQPRSLGAYMDIGDYVICSASPELFFSLDGQTLVSKPMKGTAARGLTIQDDREQPRWLKTSEKNLAENAMIVDMIRNDMGRIARPGTVAVSSLFEVERYPTVFQMTTTVSSQTSASLVEIMRAMFPCASITGAPKIRTMEIIHELESGPRGVYTGCMGYLAPGRQAKFNVAIRTVVIDRTKCEAEYGVGGGIVWDSIVEEEYAECETKSLVLTADRPKFDLLESMLWDGKNGYFLLERHLERLTGSAEYFDFAVNTGKVRKRLLAFGETIGEERHKVRLCISYRGEIRIESSPIYPQPVNQLWRLGLASKPIDSKNLFLYHKTTNREIYNLAKSKCEAVDDVLLWNEREEVTETRIGNIVVELDGKYYTPPVKSGLLGGIFRAKLLAGGEIDERVIRREDLGRAENLFVINSVRKWLPAVIQE